MQVVKEALRKKQKEISRCLAPHIQTELAVGYNLLWRNAAEEVSCNKGYVGSSYHYRGSTDYNADCVPY